MQHHAVDIECSAQRLHELRSYSELSKSKCVCGLGAMGWDTYPLPHVEVYRSGDGSAREIKQKKKLK